MDSKWNGRRLSSNVHAYAIQLFRPPNHACFSFFFFFFVLFYFVLFSCWLIHDRPVFFLTAYDGQRRLIARNQMDDFH